MRIKKPELEKIPLLIVYKQGKRLKHKVSRDAQPYELYGYLKLLIENAEVNLYDEFIEDNEKK
ncbi:hypothetical protein HYT26_02500 [Candidatus Pacearchaeota archaeon]|nr:hypothetical protein [Candidatus Pacearchaeota archaeon]